MVCKAEPYFVRDNAAKMFSWYQLEAPALLQEMLLPSHQLGAHGGHSATSKEMGDRNKDLPHHPLNQCSNTAHDAQFMEL